MVIISMLDKFITVTITIYKTVCIYAEIEKLSKIIKYIRVTWDSGDPK